MKKVGKKFVVLMKGAPTSVLVSAGIHLLLLVGLGSLVIFTAYIKPEPKFVPPPPVDRPKMDLKKPRVKVKKTTKPRSMRRITAKNVQAMPDVQLPEVSSMGSGLSGGVGGFELMPDLAEVDLLGSKSSVSVGNDLEGTLYSMRFDRRGKQLRPELSFDGYYDLVCDFAESGWNPRFFAPYYRAAQKLYATQIMIPAVQSEIVPEQFGVADIIPPECWCVHYKGRISYKDGGRFRFCGNGDAVLMVRVDGKMVLNANFSGPQGKLHQVSGYKNTSKDDRKYLLGHSVMFIGEWFSLEPGVPVDIEILIGDGMGMCQAMLLVQTEGEEYPLREDGGPMLPIFKTAEMPDPVRRKIEYHLIEGDVDLDYGPTFNVY